MSSSDAAAFFFSSFYFMPIFLGAEGRGPRTGGRGGMHYDRGFGTPIGPIWPLGISINDYPSMRVLGGASDLRGSVDLLSSD